MQPSEEPPVQRDYSGLWILGGLCSVEVAALYIVIALDTPVTPAVHRMLANPFGAFTLVMIIVTFLCVGMAILLSLLERWGKARATAATRDPDPQSPEAGPS